MTRLHKKCLIASTGTHAFLALLLVFGSAFFVATDQPLAHSKLQLVPPGQVEATLTKGGNAQELTAAPTILSPPPPSRPTRPPPSPLPPPPVASQTPKNVDPAPSTLGNQTTEATNLKRSPNPRRKINRTDLTPIKPSAPSKTETETEAERESRDAARQAHINARQKLDAQFGDALKAFQHGIQPDSAVNVGGLDGQAFADYGALVQATYADAWKIIQDFSDDDAIAVVRVTVARDGRVLSSQFITRSGNTSMDRSVQRALDKVREQHLPPFPDSSKELERRFTIEFNLKTRRLLG